MCLARRRAMSQSRESLAKASESAFGRSGMLAWCHSEHWVECTHDSNDIPDITGFLNRGLQGSMDLEDDLLYISAVKEAYLKKEMAKRWYSAKYGYMQS